MKDRLKTVRTDLGLTRKAFAEKLKITENYVYLVECGKKQNLSDRMISDICRVFNVNEEWFRTGEGQMYVPEAPDDELAKFFAEVMSDQPESIRKRWAVAFSKLSMKQWEALADIADTLAGK